MKDKIVVVLDVLCLNFFMVNGFKTFKIHKDGQKRTRGS